MSTNGGYLSVMLKRRHVPSICRLIVDESPSRRGLRDDSCQLLFRSLFCWVGQAVFQLRLQAHGSNLARLARTQASACGCEGDVDRRRAVVLREVPEEGGRTRPGGADARGGGASSHCDCDGRDERVVSSSLFGRSARFHLFLDHIRGMSRGQAGTPNGRPSTVLYLGASGCTTFLQASVVRETLF